MRSFSAHNGPPLGTPIPIPKPLTKVELLRMDIGSIADCLTRALDQADGDELDEVQKRYVTKQLDHAGVALIRAYRMLHGHNLTVEEIFVDAELLEDLDAREVWDAEDVIELTREGGAS